MIDIDKYRRIIPQTKIVNKSARQQVRNLELPCFDHIYEECADIDKDKYPYGVIITDSGAESVLDSLYDTSMSLFNIYHTKPINDKTGRCGDLVIPMFIVKDHKGNPISTSSLKSKRYFTEYVEKYSDMNDDFKVKKDGFFQVEKEKTNIMAVSQKMMRGKYSCKVAENNTNIFLNRFKISGTIRSLYIHFLTDEDIEYLYDGDMLYSYVEEYAFCYIDKKYDYLYEDNVLKYISDANAIVEPILVDEKYDGIPLLKYHAIFFPCRYYYKHFLGDITQERKRYFEVVSFYSSHSDDPVNVLFRNIYTLLIKGDIILTTLIQSENIKNTIKADYTITLNPLRNNTKFIERNLDHNLFIPVEIPADIPGYGRINMRSTEVYEVEPSYFNILKLKSEKEVTHIKEIIANKYYLDIQAEDDCNIHLNDLIYSVYIDDEKYI